MKQAILDIQGLQNRFGNQWVHTDVNLTVYPGEIIAIIGGSGCGKTTILRNMLMLLRPTGGRIQLFGHDLSQLSRSEADSLRTRWGMMFQHSALFSAFTVLENVMFPLLESTSLSPAFIKKLALLKIAMVGLPVAAAFKYPSELSGGMQRRAAAARAIAMDPELLFLDEPTTGLDPLGARRFDELLLLLRDTLKLTIIMISHDVASLKGVTDRVAFVGEGKILGFEPIARLMHNKHPLIAEYFSKL